MEKLQEGPCHIKDPPPAPSGTMNGNFTDN